MNIKLFDRFLMEEAEPQGLAGGGGAPPADDLPPAAPPEFSGPEWMKGLEAELLEDKSLQSIKDINTLAKNYINTKKMVGKDKVVIPDDHATEEDWQQFYKKLGMPERDQYKIQFGEAKYSDEFKEGFLENAFKNGLLPKQAEGLFQYFNDQVATANQTASEQAKQEIAQEYENLKKEWGSGYDKKLATAQQAFSTFADESMINYLNETGLSHDTNLIRLFAKIGESLNEDTFERGTVKHLGMTKEEAQDQVDAMMGNADHPYWKDDHPNHKKAVDEMLKFRKIIES